MPRKAVLVRGLDPHTAGTVAVQVQGNLYAMIPPEAALTYFDRIEAVSESEARVILSAGYKCEVVGAGGGRAARPAAAGEGGCGHED
jgi:hypothetical protein